MPDSDDCQQIITDWMLKLIVNAFFQSSRVHTLSTNPVPLNNPVNMAKFRSIQTDKPNTGSHKFREVAIGKAVSWFF